MLNREAQDLHKAKTVFTINTKRFELDNYVRQSDFSVCQYFNNNTIYDVTVMDNYGFRQTIKRKKQREGKTIFQIVREYRINYTHEDEIRNFFDEVTDIDGEVISAIKKAVASPDFFRTKGFGNEYLANVKSGFMFTVIFDIDQDQLSHNLTIDCQEAGVVLSRKTRRAMPVNMFYAAKNKGGYNPFRKIVGKNFTLLRVFANSKETLKNKYWYFIGDNLCEVEYTKNKNIGEGIYIEKYSKNLDSDEISIKEIKCLVFDEALNKNGFFITERDAMLATNYELTLKAREATLAEREHEMRVKEFKLREKDMEVKARVSTAKHEQELLMIGKNSALEELKYNKSVSNYAIEAFTTDKKIELAELTARQELENFQHGVVIQKLQYLNEVLKHRNSTYKHENTLEEIKLSTLVNNVTTHNKILTLEAGLIIDNTVFNRNIVENKIKESNLLLSSVSSLLKLLGK